MLRKEMGKGFTDVGLHPFNTICPASHLGFAHHRKSGSDSIALIEIISSYLQIRKINELETVYKPFHPQLQYLTFEEEYCSLHQDNGRSISSSLGSEHRGRPKYRTRICDAAPSALSSETLTGACHQGISRKSVRLALPGRRPTPSLSKVPIDSRHVHSLLPAARAFLHCSSKH
jgi:hypothetical protein